MSLNGLDHVVVTQAYQGALAEAGGWCVTLKSLLRELGQLSVLMFYLQVPPQVHVQGRCRGSDQGDWWCGRGASCCRPVR